jgi:hypothetical protein
MDLLMPGDAIAGASADAREVARMVSDQAWRRQGTAELGG